jgi:hypothetical protein
MTEFSFSLHKTDGAARLGTVRTPHGDMHASLHAGWAVGTVKGFTYQVKRRAPISFWQHLSFDVVGRAEEVRSWRRVNSVEWADPYRQRRLSGHVAGKNPQDHGAGATFQSHIDAAI